MHLIFHKHRSYLDLQTWFSNRRTKAKRILNTKFRHHSEKRVHCKCVRGKYVWRASPIHPSTEKVLHTHLSPKHSTPSESSSSAVDNSSNHVIRSSQRTRRSVKPHWKCLTCQTDAKQKSSEDLEHRQYLRRRDRKEGQSHGPEKISDLEYHEIMMELDFQWNSLKKECLRYLNVNLSCMYYQFSFIKVWILNDNAVFWLWTLGLNEYRISSIFGVLKILTFLADSKIHKHNHPSFKTFHSYSMEISPLPLKGCKIESYVSFLGL
jgi:hypothetical protein